MQSKLQKYSHYLNYTQEQRKILIEYAKQDEKPSPNPQGQHVFPIKNFIDFKVINEKNKLIQLANFKYPAVGNLKCLIIMFHGLNSHIGHGAHLAHSFAEYGMQTIGFDHRGFGQSEGTPGYVQNLKTHLSDCENFLNRMKEIYPNTPKFCLGLSMGGLASYYISSQYTNYFKGAILMAPALMNQIGGVLVGVSNFLSTILPSHTKLTGPVYGKASRNPEITQFVKKDPYAYKGRVNLATTNFLVSTMDDAPKSFISYRCPFLIIQGGCDKLVNPNVAFQLFNSSPLEQRDKDILFYTKMWHDIWHEKEIFEIIEKIKAWVDKRLAL